MSGPASAVAAGVGSTSRIGYYYHSKQKQLFEVRVDDGVNGAIYQGWAEDWTPNDIQNGPIDGSVVSTPLESPPRHLSSGAPALTNRASLT